MAQNSASIFKFILLSSLMVSCSDRKVREFEFRKKIGTELISEMMEVIFLVKNPVKSIHQETGVFIQGASLEGIHNGIVHSSRYREFEKKNPRATPQALELFLESLLWIQKEMPEPTRFTPDSAKPVGSESQEEIELNVNPLDKPRLKRIFQSASPYTLKRVLAFEALKLFHLKSESLEKKAFASFLSRWFLFFNQAKVAFGHEKRNDPDFDFHFKWSQTQDQDILVWEVLNRCHRLINSRIQNPQAPVS